MVHLDKKTIIIVGAGHGGVAAAMDLRMKGFDGEIILIEEQAGAPYERPPLSKAWLTSDDSHKANLADPKMFAARDIDFRPGTKVSQINRDGKTISTDNGETIPYDWLILATGSIARTLPIKGSDAGNVLSLRVAAEAEKIRHALKQGGHIAIIGAGYIGLEVAASARKLGVAVSIIELAERCMKRTASPELSAFYEAYHRDQGVQFHLNSSIEEIHKDNHRATSMTLSNGEILRCDMVLMAAGGLADDVLARDAGLTCDQGVIVDEDARTSDPAVFAIGDIAQRPSHFTDQLIRMESVQNAQEQAKLVSAAIMERPRPKPEAPWFWSDQYELKLQIAGIIRVGEDRIVRNEGAADKFAVFHYAGEQLNAVEAVNAPVAYMAVRKALGLGKTLDKNMAADPEADLRQAII